MDVYTDPLVLAGAFIGGVLPALWWLWFLLKEDLHPEPRKLLTLTFLGGVAAVPIALVAEKVAAAFIPSASFSLILAWAIIEECAKFGVAYFVALTRKENDEPVDNMIYIITAALGFAALENTLFLINPFSDGQVIQGIVTGHLRFIGSTLLHVVASGSIGIAYALSFCKIPYQKYQIHTIGVIIAIVLHTLFNFFILTTSDSLFAVFSFVWIGMLILFLFFEQVKRINRTCVYEV